jgi:hypothetical protein
MYCAVVACLVLLPPPAAQLHKLWMKVRQGWGMEDFVCGVTCVFYGAVVACLVLMYNVRLCKL